MGQLDGKVALITGAGRGIGRSVSILFAKEGAKVAVISRTPSTVDEVVSAIKSAGGTAIGIACDVTAPAQILAAVSGTIDAFGTVDILVNNAHATTNIQASFMNTTEELIKTQMESGFMSTFRFMRACFPYLKEKGGKVINVGSGAGITGGTCRFAYAAAKEAIRATTRAAALEWGVYGINVNVICPIGMTDALREAMEDPATAAVVQGIPLRRIGDLDHDVAPMYLFLASAASDYLTGYTLMCDGGNTIDAAR